MAKKMNRMALLSVLMTVILVVLYRDTQSDRMLTLAITFGTLSYHLVMRLVIGAVVHLLLHNRVDYRKRWFRVSEAEATMYKKLRVKKWKGKMATYDPSSFDSKIHSWEEIAQAMCQAELVHELIIAFSFLPVFAAIPFGALPVFVITSLLSACFDAMFVAMQRYNRPRIIKLIEHPGRKKSKKPLLRITASCGQLPDQAGQVGTIIESIRLLLIRTTFIHKTVQLKYPVKHDNI